MSLQAHELERHQWLEAIGIDSWLPRQPLSGAAPSPEWVETFCYPESDASSWQDDSWGGETVEEPPRPVAGAVKASGPRIDTSALLDEPRRPSERRPESSSLAPSTSEAQVSELQRATPVRAAKPEPAPRFKLAWLVREDLLIIDSLPPHQPEGFSRQHRQLLQGITNALGIKATEELSAPFMLPWPMLAGKTLNQGPDEARKAVSRKLHNTLAFKPEIRQVLLLGEAASHWVVEQEGHFDDMQGRVLELGEGRQALVTLSLSELLRLPERKAEVWCDLQPFRRDLKQDHD
ncbi:hypothetical protein [Marinobacterium sediminicola]|uniref:Uracil DNA glycosylase superfamily protein n=1 Tax=Marinobacterium sediminicola TaxID=518898 RepID=A0ABY1S0W6_9GAMM|nr:hypothetical protein [Marinobacterium sediminicola]ULG69662.1 hypothetical protein LN244_02250 [Marinobacterium sediminicola]SMR74610.1 Uracil DNA glycosylase superfamily protein [Marinobacterium sediminicola]